MSQIKFKFIEALQGLSLQSLRVDNGDTLVDAIGKLQGQIDDLTEVYIQEHIPASNGPYVWYQTFPGSQDVKEWIHDGFSDLLRTSIDAVLDVGGGFVLRVN